MEVIQRHGIMQQHGYRKLAPIFVFLPDVYALELHLASTINAGTYHFQAGYVNSRSTVIKSSYLILQGSFPH